MIQMGKDGRGFDTGEQHSSTFSLDSSSKQPPRSVNFLGLGMQKGWSRKHALHSQLYFDKL